MVFIIVPAVIALVAGVAALGAAEGRREAAEQREREEADRRTREARREATEKQREAAETQRRAGQAIAAEQFIAMHKLSMTPERLGELARSGVTPVLRVLETASRWTRDLERESTEIRRLQNEMKAATDLMDVIKRRVYP